MPSSSGSTRISFCGRTSPPTATTRAAIRPAWREERRAIAEPSTTRGIATASRVQYSLGQQRLFSGRALVGRGTFYDGTRTEASYNGRVGIVPQFAVEPGIWLNWVDLPYGTFSARLLTSRFILTPTPRMMLSSLVQFNASAHTVSSSVRLRWEYLAGSELFVAYSDDRDTLGTMVEGLLNRSVAIKARLLRF